MRATRLGFGRHPFVLAILVSLWLAFTGLLVVSRGNPEAFLSENLGRQSRADAFKHLNSVLPRFWFVHSSLVLTVIALAFNLFYQEWSDPDWYVFVAVSTIGWVVSTIVGGVYWSLPAREGLPDLSQTVGCSSRDSVTPVARPAGQCKRA